MLKLLNIGEEDLPLIMSWRMLPEVTKYMYTDPKLTLEKQKLWYDLIKDDKGAKYWIIEIDDTKIGLINIANIDYQNKRCLWAYYIGDTSFRGRGIATLLECNIYDYVFENLELNKLCCEVFAFNEKVISIHEKFGSKVEGVLREHIYKNGEYHDVVVMGIIKDEWEKIKSQFNYEKIFIE